MWRIARCLGVVLTVISAWTPASAQEACKQADIAGRWEFFGGGGAVDGPWNGMTACRLRISAQGVPSGPCVDDDGATVQVVGGSLRLQPNCLAGGQLSLRNPNGRRQTIRIPRAVLSRSGDELSGIITEEVNGVLFSGPFQMYRF